MLAAAAKDFIKNKCKNCSAKISLKASLKASSMVVWAALCFSILGFSPVWAYDVIAGGQSLGIVLKSEGAVVVGFAPVVDSAGAEVYPAREAGVETEDVLIAINDQPVSSNQQVAELINELGRQGEPVELTLLHEGKTRKLDVQPVLCQESGLWRIGLYIRDANAGIGTLTFYDEAEGRFAALGHRIADNSADESPDGEPIGRVLAADVQYIQNSVEGEPGEKVGVFDKDSLNGVILKNCELGIYGELAESPVNPLYPEPLEVADASEVKPGPATILTVLDGERLEEFAVEIERVMPQKRAADKGMVIKVTDERLLSRAGGIVQGMSGSPIIQNGKLVGAVTHVFVNDTCTGYGCFAQWMLEEVQSL